MGRISQLLVEPGTERPDFPFGNWSREDDVVCWRQVGGRMFDELVRMVHAKESRSFHVRR